MKQLILTMLALSFGVAYSQTVAIEALTNTGATTFQVKTDGSMYIHNGTQKTLQLTNTGMLQARKVKVDTETWPDYVFTPEYTLMPIKELEIYINENGHLPNVPSQKEVVSEGIDLGQMNIILMEKVEELSIYMIQMQKEIDLLKSKLEEAEK